MVTDNSKQSGVRRDNKSDSNIQVNSKQSSVRRDNKSDSIIRTHIRWLGCAGMQASATAWRSKSQTQPSGMESRVASSPKRSSKSFRTPSVGA
jgi:hypothetical protein